MDAYGYDTGPYEGYINETNNDKVIAKLDWNINPNNVLTLPVQLPGRQPRPAAASVRAQLQQHRPGAQREQPAVPELRATPSTTICNSFALELNSRSSGFANRFFASYNRFRDHRTPFSADFPTIEIGEGGVTYTTVGHEPFSIHNILDQDVWQLTNNFTWFQGRHSFTLGGELRDLRLLQLVQHLPARRLLPAGFRRLPSGQHVLVAGRVLRRDRSEQPRPARLQVVRSGAGRSRARTSTLASSASTLQDEFLVSERFNLTRGVRVDFPMYFTDPVDNPFSRGLTALDENGQPETVDQSSLPGTQAAVLAADRLQLERRRATAAPRSAAAPASSPAAFPSSGSAT